MAAMSLNASTMKLAVVFLVCLAIFSPSTKTLVTANFDADFNIIGCIPFVAEGAMCAVEALKSPTSAIKTCCEAVLKLNDCDSNIFKSIPQSDMDIVKQVCDAL
ncbi:hypothetical protein SDJN03_15888, partial [Cucurbita argyrosperma subsp. sororia]